MPNNFKKGLLVATVIASSALVTACNVEADLPSEVADQAVVNLDGITNNELDTIFDALVSSGSTNSSHVLEELLLILANTQLGTYFDETFGTLTMDGLSTYTSDDQFSSFAGTHSSSYPNTVAAGATVDGEGAVRAKIFLNFLKKEINESFMSNVGNSSYTEDNLFYEELFYNDIKSSLYDLEDVDANAFKGKDANGKDVGINVRPSAPFDVTTDYGSEQVKMYFQDNYMEVYADYIKRSILPDVMRSALVSQYLYNRNYSVFGKSAARNVQFIGLSDVSEYPTATQNLVTSYAKIVLADNGTLDDTDKAAIKAAYHGNLYDLNFLADLYKGYWHEENYSSNLYTAASKIYEAAFSSSTQISATVNGETYYGYPETTFGGYIYDYNKIKIGTTGSRYDNDDDIYSDFTGSGSHSAEVGFQLKIDSLIAVDETTEGWYTESTISDLPSTYSSRLFKVTVANDVDTSTTHEDGNDGLDYGYYVNNNYYLSRTSWVTNNSTDIKTDPTPILLYDSSTWYIVRVDEAVKASKLRKEGEFDVMGSSDGNAWLGSINTVDEDGALIQGNGVAYRDEIVAEIGGMLSSNDSYVSNARQYYVEQTALAYHDTEVYEYFEDTFPDLFD